MVAHRPALPRVLAVLLGGALSAALVATSLSPAWANEDGGGRADRLGGFALGDALEALVDEHDGSLRVELPLGPLRLAWDSRAIGADPYGFGPGVDLGLTRIERKGGTRVSRGSRGWFEPNAQSPSGLDGYTTRDVLFRAVAGELDARPGASGAAPDHAGGRVPYDFVLRELGGTTTYFDGRGEPVVQVTADGGRSDYVWSTETPHRLLAFIDPDGVVTELDWRSAPDTVIVRSGTNLGVPAREWRVGIGRGVSVEDPVGDTVELTTAPSGLVTRVDTASGASTHVAWQTSADAVARVDELRTADAATGTTVSSRRWSATAGVAAWPVRDPAMGPSGTGGRFTTTLSDGATRVVSDYDARQLLVERRVEASTPAGSRVVLAQSFAYPTAPCGGTAPAAELAGGCDRPARATVTHTDDRGRTRSSVEEFAFDEFGRPTRRVDATGTVTESGFPPASADPDVLPASLPTVTRVTAPDGLIAESRSTLDPTGTTVLAEETFGGRSGHALTRTGRTEYTVDGGFVTSERTFPQGGSGTPTVTEHTRSVDPERGVVATETTVAVGTPAQATTSTVASLVDGATVASTDAVGNTTRTAYDGAGRVIRRIDAGGNETTLDYESADRDGRNTTRTTTPDSVVTTEERDVLGRVIRVTDNVRDGEPVDGHVRVVELRDHGTPGTVEITDAWGAVTRTTKDVLGRVTSTTGANGVTQVTDYDDVASTKTVGITPSGDLADAELLRTDVLDARGEIASTTGSRADGGPVEHTSTVRDGLGRTVGSSDDAATTTVELDVFGNPATSTRTPAPTASASASASAETTITATRRFDERGASREKTLTGAGESRAGRRSSFDVLGRAVAETDQLDRTTTTLRTPDGLPERIEHADGRITTIRYDQVTRHAALTRTERPDGSAVEVAASYDTVTGRRTAVFDPAAPDTTRISTTYDAFGNVLTVAYPDGAVIAHEYDAHGRRIATTDAAGLVTSFEHSPGGLLTAAVQRTGGGTELARVDYRHDRFGRVTELRRGNGVVTDVSYTSASQIAAERTTRHGEAESERDYAYDSRGNLTRRTDTVHDHTDGPVTTTTVYSYDAHDRLVTSAVSAGRDPDSAVTTSTTYRLNVSGDVVEERETTGPGSDRAATTTRRFSYAPTGELTSVERVAADGSSTTAAQSYDGAGNLVRRVDGTTYEYDHLSRPVRESAPDGRVTTTEYWADGARRRVETSAPGQPTASVEFHWDDDTLLTETHDTGGIAQGTASYLIGATRSARITIARDAPTGDTIAPDVAYFVEDRHGNVTALTDAAGATRVRYAYSDYGVTTATLDAATAQPGPLARNPYQYANQYAESSGTHRLGQRTYDPGLARFTTPDPTPLHSRHGFANANPITNVDPSGFDAIADLVNGLTIGLAVFMALGTLTSAAITGGASLSVLGVIGLTADVVGSAAAVAQIVDDHHPFMPRYVKQGLTYAEYGLTGLGFVGLASALPELARRGLAGRHLRGLQKEIPDYLTGRLHRLGEFQNSPAYDWFKGQQSDAIGAAHRSAVDAVDDGLRKALDAIETPWQDNRLLGGDLIDALVTAQRSVHQLEQSIGVAKATMMEVIDLASDLAPMTKAMYTQAVRDGLFQLGSHRDRFRHLLALKTGGARSAVPDEFSTGPDWGGQTTANEHSLLLTDD
jgi:RHS repeat-associated protein